MDFVICCGQGYLKFDLRESRQLVELEESQASICWLRIRFCDQLNTGMRSNLKFVMTEQAASHWVPMRITLVCKALPQFPHKSAKTKLAVAKKRKIAEGIEAPQHAVSMNQYQRFRHHKSFIDGKPGSPKIMSPANSSDIRRLSPIWGEN